MGQESKIRMQDSKVKISRGKISNGSKDSRNGEVSRADRTA
jgi:hypothetical protein